MDDKTLGILIMGSIVVAMGAFGSYMDWRQKAQDEQRRKSQVRRLRPLRRLHAGTETTLGKRTAA